ncbi:MAG: DUF2147 domain-containing protein [Hyphomicrobiales bacterium]|nr:DUF2147 domain-containing protein [Hyphomicrobiales bacterium]
MNASTGPDVSGVWIDHTGQGAVEIGPCPGAPQKLCGHVVWMREPLDKTGRPRKDDRNPDRAKRGQPMCGTQIIGDLAPGTAGAWDNGWIYNPEDGDRFDVEVRLRARDQLQVLGYMGLKFLGETFAWKRAPADLARCTRG